MSRRGHSRLPVEERVRVVLAVLSGELTIAEAARRHGTTGKTVGEWRTGSWRRARLGWRT